MFIEADFLREYGIDLSERLDSMTWRQFNVLMRGLSRNSATVTSILGRTQFGGKKKEKTVLVEGGKNVDRFFESQFGNRH